MIYRKCIEVDTGLIPLASSWQPPSNTLATSLARQPASNLLATFCTKIHGFKVRFMNLGLRAHPPAVGGGPPPRPKGARKGDPIFWMGGREI